MNKPTRRRLSRQAGVTLIEMLVVVTIIALFASIVGPRLFKAADGAKVGKQHVVLDRPIKAIGVYDVKVTLHAEVIVMVKVNVARSPEEADLQSQGVDVMAEMFEKDTAGFTEDYDPNAEPGEIAVEMAEAKAAEAAPEA